MMNWIDPIECLAAEDALKCGRIREAAEILLQSKRRGYRAVRALLIRVSDLLLRDARKCITVFGSIDIAWELVTLAERCTALATDDVVFKRQIELLYETRNKNREIQRLALEEAIALSRDGRLNTALEALASEPPSLEGMALKRKLEQQIARFEQYVGSCREYLDRQEWEAARSCLERANSEMPSHPELHALASRFPKENLDSRYEAEYRPPELTTSIGGAITRDRRGLLIDNLLLMLFQPEILVGTARDNMADLPLLRPGLRSRHAVIRRHDGCYSIEPLPKARVAVDEHLLSNGNAHSLQHGQLIKFGNDNLKCRFLQPLVSSGTALLDFSVSQSTKKLFALPCNRDTQRIVLMDDEFVIALRAEECHLPMLEWPCRRLRFDWDKRNLHATLEGAIWGDHPDPWRQLSLPGRLAFGSGPSEDEDLCLSAEEQLVKMCAGYGPRIGNEKTEFVAYEMFDPFCHF